MLGIKNSGMDFAPAIAGAKNRTTEGRSSKLGFVDRLGTETQRQKWLVPLIRGEMLGGFGLTEPGGSLSKPRESLWTGFQSQCRGARLKSISRRTTDRHTFPAGQTCRQSEENRARRLVGTGNAQAAPGCARFFSGFRFPKMKFGRPIDAPKLVGSDRLARSSSRSSSRRSRRRGGHPSLETIGYRGPRRFAASRVALPGPAAPAKFS